MTRFSANLGFLWKDLPLPDAIRAAKAAGFDAVECHWPYDTPASEVKSALKQTGLEMLGLNTSRGDLSAGQMGLSALPGCRDNAIQAIEQAIDYADEVGAKAVHVMAGVSEGAEAEAVFVQNLTAACQLAMPSGLTILIEPLNPFDVPGYFLRNTEQARALIERVGAANLKMMFDCYHVGRTEGDVSTTLRQMITLIGHIQFAAVPDRGAPDHGEVDYRRVFDQIAELGWTQPLGAEYKPDGATDDSLGWMAQLR